MFALRSAAHRAQLGRRWLQLVAAQGAPRRFPGAEPTPVESKQLLALARSALGAEDPTLPALFEATDEGITATRFTAVPPDTGAFVVYRTFAGDTAVGACFAETDATLLAACSDGHWAPEPPGAPALADCLNGLGDQRK